MPSDTKSSSYWLNWRFLLCAIWVSIAMVFSALLIWSYEGQKEKKTRNQGNEEDEGDEKECLYDDEVWETCSKSIHPFWLFAYRILSFCFLLASLLADSIIHGGFVFYFYTEWTYTLITIYFGLGSVLSINGCLRSRHQQVERDSCDNQDSKRGSYMAPKMGGDTDVPGIDGTNTMMEFVESNRRAASIWGYGLQIIFQICAGAVVVTDSVFWLIIYPTIKRYPLKFLIVCWHSVNAVLLFGEMMLNNLRFPFFRIGYFVLWTCVFVLFQWIVHACISIRWPYPFLDWSSPYAPFWYLALGLLHAPCFGLYAFLFWIKQSCHVTR